MKTSEKSLRERVERLLDEKLRPNMAAHGGGVEVISLEEGILKFRSTGPCAHCPSAILETEELFAQTVKAARPEIQEVRLVNGVGDDLLAAAREIMGKR